MADTTRLDQPHPFAVVPFPAPLTPFGSSRQIYRDIYSLRRGVEPQIKLLYVTPERIAKSESFKEMLAFLYDKVRRAAIHTMPPYCTTG